MLFVAGHQVEQIGCKIKFIEGDGNCLFRSLADQLEGRPQDHSAVRAKVGPALAELDFFSGMTRDPASSAGIY